MPGGWNGSGVFTRYYGTDTWQNDAAAGTLILASRHDNNDQGMATGINACLTKNGENAFTGLAGMLRPAVDGSANADLGTALLRWRNLYLSTSTIYQGGTYSASLGQTPFITANRTLYLPDVSATLAPVTTTLADAVATTSGSTVTLVATGGSVYTAAYTEIVVIFDAVSSNGTAPIYVQLADQLSGFITAGYNCGASYMANGVSPVVSLGSGAGFNITTSGAGGGLRGQMVFNRRGHVTATKDLWTMSGSFYVGGATAIVTVTGAIELTVGGGIFDGIRVTTANTFDAGNITVLGRW